MPKYTITQTITAFTSYVVEAENGEIAESLDEEYGEEVDRKEERVYPEGSIRWLDHQQTEVTTDREWTSLELAHLMADRHAQGGERVQREAQAAFRSVCEVRFAPHTHRPFIALYAPHTHAGTE